MTVYKVGSRVEFVRKKYRSNRTHSVLSSAEPRILSSQRLLPQIRDSAHRAACLRWRDCGPDDRCCTLQRLPRGLPGPVARSWCADDRRRLDAGSRRENGSSCSGDGVTLTQTRQKGLRRLPPESRKLSP